MKQTSGPARKPAEAVTKDIRRAMRRQILNRAATEGLSVTGMHLAARCRIERANAGSALR